jgi:hypothetical protein
LPGRSGHVASLIATETGHTVLNCPPSFSSLLLFDVSAAGLSAYAATVTWCDIATLQLGLHSSEKTRSTRQSWRSYCARTCCPRRRSRRQRYASYGRYCGTGRSWCGCGRCCRTGWIHAVLADHGHDRPAGCWSGPGREWLASLDLPAISAEVISDALALIDALESVIGRLDLEVRQYARSDPRGSRS